MLSSFLFLLLLPVKSIAVNSLSYNNYSAVVTSNFSKNYDPNQFESVALTSIEETGCPLSKCEGNGELIQTKKQILNANSLTCVTTKKNLLGVEIERYTTPQSFGRCFKLKEEGCKKSRSIKSVSFGVESIKGGPISVTVNIYRDCGCRRGRPLSNQLSELIGGVSINLSDADSSSMKTVSLSNVVVAEDDAIFVEIQQVSSKPADVKFYHFFPGTTNAACAPTYHTSSCVGGVWITLTNLPAAVNSNLIVSLATEPSQTKVTKLNCCVDNTDCASYEDCAERQCVLKEVCANPPRDTCTFYRSCLEADVQCGSEGYPLNFGERMCNLFLNNDDVFTVQGQKWSSDVRKCLQDTLVDRIYSEMSCPASSDYAYDTHPKCYIDTGFCNLNTCEDYVELGLLLKKDVWSLEAFKQIVLMIRECGGDILYKCRNPVGAMVKMIFKNELNVLLRLVDKTIDGIRDILQEKFLNPIEPNLPSFIIDIREGSTIIEVFVLGNETNPAGRVVDMILAKAKDGVQLTSNVTLEFEYGQTCKNSEQCKKLFLSCGSNFNKVQIYQKRLVGGKCRELCVSRFYANILLLFRWKDGRCKNK